MKKRIPLLFSLAAITLAVLLSCSQETPKVALTPEEEIKQLLHKTYGNYDPKEDAWIIQANSACHSSSAEDKSDCGLFNERPGWEKTDYPMKIRQIDKVNASGKEQYYVLVTADIPASRPETGLFGLFVFEKDESQLKMTANTPYTRQGAFGTTNTIWELIQLNDSDYWGWRTHNGYKRVDWTEIHAPHEGEVVPLLVLSTIHYWDGPWFENLPEGKQFPMLIDLKAEISFDTSVKNAKVYPIKATVTGTLDGKKFRPRTWDIPFDEKTWRYRYPEDWPVYDPPNR